jgi:hypothetical protein
MRMAWKLSCTCALGLFGLVTACSDPVGPAAQGAMSLDMTTTVGPMLGICPPGAHWINVPFSPTRAQQTSATSKGALGVDGQNQVAISCTVRDNGGGVFGVSGSLKAPATDPNGMAVNPTQITLSTTLGSDQSALGSLTVKDNATGTFFSSVDDQGQAAATCMFSVHRLQMTDQLDIAAGRIWGSVTCPRIRDTGSSNAAEVCAISPGFFVLENCGQ